MFKIVDNGKDALNKILHPAFDNNDHQHFLQCSIQSLLAPLFYLSGHQPPYSSLILYSLNTQTLPILILVLFASFRFILEHVVHVFRKFVYLKQWLKVSNQICIVGHVCDKSWLVFPTGCWQSEVASNHRYLRKIFANCHDNERTVKETMATNWHKSSYIWHQMWWWSDLPHRMISCRFGIISGNKALSFVTIKITSSELIGDIIAHLQSVPRKIGSKNTKITNWNHLGMLFAFKQN